jgi:hypothetical protein
VHQGGRPAAGAVSTATDCLYLQATYFWLMSSVLRRTVSGEKAYQAPLLPACCQTVSWWRMAVQPHSGASVI